jgi:mRNA-degrading endonuclease toxin of MazEF toxin-antitoxin module
VAPFFFCALFDQLRTIDKCRIRRVFGGVSAAEVAETDDVSRLFLGLDG